MSNDNSKVTLDRYYMPQSAYGIHILLLNITECIIKEVNNYDIHTNYIVVNYS